MTIAHYQDVIVIVFQYIQMLQSEPVHEWIFKEVLEYYLKFTEDGI
jgi:secreted Zn-dependent insulinase-like peptidase